MSSDLKAEAVIELETSSLEASSDKVKKEFEEVGKSAVKGGAKADKALDKTGEKAKKTAGKLKDTGTAGKKAGDDVAAGADKGSRSLDRMATSTDSADNSMETLSTSMIGLAQTVTGVTDAVFGLSASLVGLEKTQFGIKGMEIAVRRMEEDLIVAFQSGVATTRELQRSTEDLGLAYQGLSLEAKQAAADELALNGQLVTITINTVAAIVQSAIMISTLITMRGVRSAVTTATVADSAATVANTGVNAANTTTVVSNATAKAANTGITAVMTGAILASAGAVKALTLAMLTSPLAPYAIAAIAAGTAFIALNDNIGGVRDSIEDLTGFERGSIPTLGFSITGLGNDINETGDEFDDFQKQSQTFLDSIEEGIGSMESFQDTANDGMTPALNKMGGSIIKTTGQMKAFTLSVGGASQAIDEFSKKNETLGDLSAAALAESASILRQRINEKGLIDVAMMQALQDAEAAGLIAQGTSGQFRTTSGFNQSGQVRATNIKNISGTSLLLRGFGLTGIGNPGAGIGAGTRNRKTQQLARVFANQQSVRAQASSLNSFFGSGFFGEQSFTANRSRPSIVSLSKDQSYKFGRLGLNAGTPNLLARTGISIDSFFGQTVSMPIFAVGSRSRRNGRHPFTQYYNYIKGYQQITTGPSGEARLAAITLANAEAKREVSLLNQLEALNPNLQGTINLAGSGITSSFLTKALSDETARLSNASSVLGISQSEVISIEALTGGTQQISDMLAFKDKLAAMSTSVA